VKARRDEKGDQKALPDPATQAEGDGANEDGPGCAVPGEGALFIARQGDDDADDEAEREVTEAQIVSPRFIRRKAGDASASRVS